MESMKKVFETKRFYKNNKNDKVWWIDYEGIIGRLDVSFDKKKILSLWQEYPKNFTKEEKELFDKENPYWADFFRDRCLEMKTKGLKYKFLKYTYVSELEEGCIDELQEKYDFVYPDIMRDYYENYNESVIQACEFKANGVNVLIDNIISIKYGNECLEELLSSNKCKLILRIYIPFARNVLAKFFYFSKEDGCIYTDKDEGYSYGIKNPIKICNSFEELFEIIEKNIKIYEF